MMLIGDLIAIAKFLVCLFVCYGTVEEASVGKATSQSRTLEDRLARYAVDGNTNGTDLSTCATSLSDLSSTQYQWAWWQVNLGDFYLVKAITVYFPTVRPG